MAAIAAEPATRGEILRLETAALSAWPAIKTAYDGAMLWRFASGLSKRANSIQSLDVADDTDATARIERLAELSRVHLLPPLFRVTPLAGPGIIASLDAAGWSAFEESLVLSMPMPQAEQEVAHRVRQFNVADPDWYGTQGEMAGYVPQTVRILGQLMMLVPYEARGMLAVSADGTPAAAAMVVNAGGVAIFLNVVTDPALRGRGYGRAVMNAALNWARDDGAEQAALQVIASNAVALNLYGSMGFMERYRYHYRKAPE